MDQVNPETLPQPDSALAMRYIASFDRNPRIGAPDRSLATLVELFPKNVQIEHILLKVSALNGLYSTNIFAVTDVAIHISHQEIDPLIAVGDLSAVERVANVELSGKVRRNYSFATKYCSMHAPTIYPIYDTFVDKLLWLYRKKDKFATFRHMDLLSYSEFIRIIDQFRDYYELLEFSYKALDKFLWSLGKEVFGGGS